jgi:hypothetical protein
LELFRLSAIAFSKTRVLHPARPASFGRRRAGQNLWLFFKRLPRPSGLGLSLLIINYSLLINN